MAEDIFSSEELKWLQTHPEMEEHINESLEDSLNVNPLDSGEPDLIPYQQVVKAAQITIEIAEKKLIAGPYDNLHWLIICKHLSGYASLINKDKIFWNLFSFHCACFKEQDENCISRIADRSYVHCRLPARDDHQQQHRERQVADGTSNNTVVFKPVVLYHPVPRLPGVHHLEYPARCYPS